MIEEIEITNKGIKKTLAGMSPEKAIAEYIWNGFDAGATSVRVEARPATQEMETIDQITIADNGTGIRLEELNTKFKPYLESAKAARKSSIKTSHQRGEEGKGRLSFCMLAKAAVWNTVYVEKGKRYGYTIKINEATLGRYEPSEKREIEAANGTVVTLTGVSQDFTTHVVETVLRDFLRTEFCWYLRLNEKAGKSIELNGQVLDYRSLMLDTGSCTVTHPDSGAKFQIDFIQWEKRQEEYSKLYFLNDSQDEKFKRNSRFNNKGDQFYHSLYVTSSFFNNVLISTDTNSDDEMSLPFEANQRKAFNFLLTELDSYLRAKRRNYLAGTSEQSASCKASQPRLTATTWNKLDCGSMTASSISSTCD